MRTSNLLLLALLVALNGCIVKYQGFPDTRFEHLPNDNGPALPGHPGFELCDLQPPPYSAAGHWARDFIVGLNLLNPVYWLMYPQTVESAEELSTQLQGVHVPVQGSQVIFASRPDVATQEGTICIARITTTQKLTFMENANSFFSGLTLAIIPMYTPEALAYSVTFSVSTQTGPPEEYQYRFSKGGVAGLLVLPFAWINWFTSSEQEAFQAVFQQFLVDRQRDH